MISKTVAAALLGAGCVTAAAGGAYLAVRQNAAEQPAAVTASPSPTASPGDPRPVTETEAVVGASPEAPAPAEAVETPSAPAAGPAGPAPARRPAAVPPRDSGARAARRVPAPRPADVRQREVTAAPAPPAPAGDPIMAPQVEPLESGSAAARPAADPARVAELPAVAPAPRFEELVVPSASVIGLQVETPISSERARVEDRVDGRVTRDVLAAGRVAIPAGSRVVGAVTLVERGGKVKERARLGVRFHTLVLADGTQVPLRTDAIYREGQPPSGESARKIGGAAIGGAILGAIMGGGKGAVIGGATGAGAGTAAVMAGDRNAATLPAGTVVTVRLNAPATIEVERR